MSLIHPQHLPESLQSFFGVAVTQDQINQATNAMKGPYVRDEVIAFVFKPQTITHNSQPILHVVSCAGLAGHNDSGSGEVDMTELNIGEMTEMARFIFSAHAGRGQISFRQPFIIAFDTSRTASLLSNSEAQNMLTCDLDRASRPLPLLHTIREKLFRLPSSQP